MRLDIAGEYARLNGIDTVENPESESALGIVATGKSYTDIKQTLRLLHLEDRIPILKLGVIYPVNRQTIRDFAHGFQNVLRRRGEGALRGRSGSSGARGHRRIQRLR